MEEKLCLMSNQVYSISTSLYCISDTFLMSYTRSFLCLIFFLHFFPQKTSHIAPSKRTAIYKKSFFLIPPIDAGINSAHSSNDFFANDCHFHF